METQLKTLVVFYSRRREPATVNPPKIIGNTKKVVNIIKEFINFDEYEIEPKEFYPYDYDGFVKIVQKEHDTNFSPEILDKPLPDLSKYDKIIIGYPVWWDTCPLIFNTFFSKFSSDAWKGKTIIPLATHEGSKFGKSIDYLKKMLPNTKFEQGFEINAHQISHSKNNIKKWLSKIYKI